MKILFYVYGVVTVILAAFFSELAGFSPTISFILGLSIPVIVFFSFASYYLFTRRGQIKLRAMSIDQARKKRIEMMNLYTSLYDDPEYDKIMEEESIRQVARMGFGDNYSSR